MATINPTPRPPRLIARSNEDRFMVVPIGSDWHWLNDTYARLLDAPWRRLFAFIALGYLTINLIFALLYFLGDGIENTHPGYFPDYFFFSVQTFATIGYGRMAPVGIYANLMVTLEAFLGFAFYAMTTGLVFAKFSRPTARVMFSNVAVIAPYRGMPHLMLRMANQRRNRIVDARVQLVLWQEESAHERMKPRRFIDLSLVRDQVPLMQLAWTIMHRIDEHSPLFGETPETLRSLNSELIVSLSGLDETLAQTIHARYSYLPDEIQYDREFEDVILRREDRKIEVHYDKFHNTKPIMLNASSLPRLEEDPAVADLLKICNPQNYRDP